MLRLSLYALLGLFALMPVTPASADWHSFWNRVHVDWHRNNCWPVPFSRADRDTVCEAMSVQLANGWKRQNTLSDVHFDSDSQNLNEAGRMKLRDILATSPQQYRKIYIVEPLTDEAEARRIDSVQLRTSELLDDEPLPEIATVKIAPRSWRAEYIFLIDARRLTSMPQPKLPEFTSTTGGGQ